MTNKKIEQQELDVNELTVKEALALGLIILKSEMPLTNGDLSRRVEYLVRETTMSYADIVEQIKSEFPHAKTTTKSVASVACVMRKSGTFVPYRLKMNQL